jgi:ankyrin repeat protein
VNAKDGNGVSAILLAIYYGRPEIAEVLIDRGAQLDGFEAAAAGRVDRMRALLEEDAALANACAPDGFQPLGLASFFGHKPVVDLLLSYDAEVNSASKNRQRVMPLNSAVAGGHTEIARMLLERGADVNARQAGDFAPLHGAAQNGQMEMVELLLAFGADKGAQSAKGQTPRSIALENGHDEVANLLR